MQWSVMHPISRRSFLRVSAGTTFGLAAGFPTLGRGGEAGKVVLGLVGCGGRGSMLADGFLARGGVEFAHLCDVDGRRSSALAKQLAPRQKTVPKLQVDYRAVLDDKAVDALIVATPDHWHALPVIQACQAGKHAYVEKPASHTIWEGRKMVEAARKYRRLVQVGTQGRSAPYVHEAVEYLRSGQLGRIHLCKVFNLKNGVAYRKPANAAVPTGVDFDRWMGAVDPGRHDASVLGGWYYWFDFCGGDTGNDGIHQLDLARLLIGKTVPRAVVATGGRLAFPDADGDVHDTQAATFDFGDLLMTFELTQWAPYMDKIAPDIRQGAGFPYWPQCATRIEIYGTKGLMYLGRHGGGWQVFGPPEKQSRPGKLLAEKLGRFPDPEHQDNFLSAIREGVALRADIEEGHYSAILPHLANISMRVGGRRLVFDPEREHFGEDSAANALLKRAYRPAYAVPDAV